MRKMITVRITYLAHASENEEQLSCIDVPIERRLGEYILEWQDKSEYVQRYFEGVVASFLDNLAVMQGFIRAEFVSAERINARRCRDDILVTK